MRQPPKSAGAGGGRLHVLLRACLRRALRLPALCQRWRTCARYTFERHGLTRGYKSNRAGAGANRRPARDQGDNAFKIRAYRAAADVIATWPDAVARMDAQQLRAIPGVGKDLAAKVRELAETGASPYHQELLAQFPPTILDLLRLQGVGPKTVAMLYSTLNISTLEGLAAAAVRVAAFHQSMASRQKAHIRSPSRTRQGSGRHC